MNTNFHKEEIHFNKFILAIKQPSAYNKNTRQENHFTVDFPESVCQMSQANRKSEGESVAFNHVGFSQTRPVCETIARRVQLVNFKPKSSQLPACCLSGVRASSSYYKRNKTEILDLVA